MASYINDMTLAHISCLGIAINPALSILAVKQNLEKWENTPHCSLRCFAESIIIMNYNELSEYFKAHKSFKIVCWVQNIPSSRMRWQRSTIVFRDSPCILIALRYHTSGWFPLQRHYRVSNKSVLLRNVISMISNRNAILTNITTHKTVYTINSNISLTFIAHLHRFSKFMHTCFEN